jgi:hypothetical protein
VPEVEEINAATITYIQQPNRTVIVHVEKHGEEPFDLVADIYSEEELAAIRVPSVSA